MPACSRAAATAAGVGTVLAIAVAAVHRCGMSCAGPCVLAVHSRSHHVASAGLSAARQLRNHGYKVVVLEGAERPGGRVHTHRMEVGSHRFRSGHCQQLHVYN
jgi:hypothetical protein